MHSAGFELKRARERQGLSAEQIEERTKVQLQKIQALERGNFESLPAGIYLDGIVGAYANEVGLDPEPLIERVRAEREQAAQDWGEDFGDLDGVLQQERPTGHPEPRADIQMRDSTPVEHTMFRTATGRQWPRSVRRKRRNLAVPLLALLASAGWTAYLYEVARRPARGETPVVAAPSTPRSETPSPDMTARESAATTPAESPPAATAPAPSLDAKAVPAPQVSIATAGTATTDPSPRPEAAPSSVSVARAGDVSGTWRLATRVESSTYADFIGLNLGYDITLQQTGERITGSGRKVSENGGAIGAAAQTAVSLAGTMAGNRLTLTFTEQGAQRPTQEKFVLLLEEAGTLRGRFSSTAAQSSGTVVAERVK